MQNHAFMGNYVAVGQNAAVGLNMVVGYGNYVNAGQNVVIGHNKMYKRTKPENREPNTLIPPSFIDVISAHGFGPAREYGYLNIPKFTFRTYGDFGIAQISSTDESIMINFLALNESIESYFRHFVEQNKGFTNNSMYGGCSYRDIREALSAGLSDEDESSAEFFKQMYGDNYYYIKITSDNCDFGLKNSPTIYFQLNSEDLQQFREIVMDIINSANREFELLPALRSVQIGSEKFVGVDGLSPLMVIVPENEYTSGE